MHAHVQIACVQSIFEKKGKRGERKRRARKNTREQKREDGETAWLGAVSTQLSRKTKTPPLDLFVIVLCAGQQATQLFFCLGASE